MDPYDAMQAFYDLGAKHFIPIHWGNFRLSLEKPDEPPQLLEHAARMSGASKQIHILKNGENILLTL